MAKPNTVGLAEFENQDLIAELLKRGVKMEVIDDQSS